MKKVITLLCVLAMATAVLTACNTESSSSGTDGSGVLNSAVSNSSGTGDSTGDGTASGSSGTGDGTTSGGQDTSNSGGIAGGRGNLRRNHRSPEDEGQPTINPTIEKVLPVSTLYVAVDNDYIYYNQRQRRAHLPGQARRLQANRS